MGKFTIKKTETGCSFRLKAGNGQVIAVSQTYSTDAGCLKGIRSVKTIAPVAEIEDQTAEGYELKKNPKFEVYTDKKGEFRFRIKARNGQIVASSEGYKGLDSCMKGIASVRKNAPEAEIETEA